MKETKDTIPQTDKKKPSWFHVLMWILSSAFLGGYVAFNWASSFVYMKAQETVPNIGFLWDQLDNLTMEYLKFLLYATGITILNAKLTLTDLVFMAFVSFALVGGFTAAGLAFALFIRRMIVGRA